MWPRVSRRGRGTGAGGGDVVVGVVVADVVGAGGGDVAVDGAVGPGGLPVDEGAVEGVDPHPPASIIATATLIARVQGGCRLRSR